MIFKRNTTPLVLKTVLMVSLPPSNSTLCSSIPQNFHKKRGFRESRAWVSLSAPHFSSTSRKLFTNGNLVPRKISLCAKSDDLEIENQQLPAHLTKENGGISGNEGNPSTTTSFLSFLCPLLKLLSGGDPSKERNYNFEIAASSFCTLARLPWGSRSICRSPDNIDFDPPLRLQLFEFEACPFCRRVREALTELDLLVEVYPCPKGSVRNRDTVRRFGGKEQFPFLVDPNTGVSIYESSDIVKYLFQQYGQGRSPTVGLLESTLVTGWIPTLLRAGRGMTLWEKARPEQPPEMLQLFSFENNPFARLVREALCELELPYILYNVGEGSRRAKLLVNLSGSTEVPYFVDPNTGTQIGDYKKILMYLFQNYSKSNQQ